MLGVIEYFAKLLKVIVNGNIRKPGCGFLFAFHSNYGPVFYHFRDKARYWSKITIFFHIPQWSKSRWTHGTVPARPNIEIQRSRTSNFIKAPEGSQAPTVKPKADVQFPHLCTSTAASPYIRI